MGVKVHYLILSALLALVASQAAMSAGTTGVQLADAVTESVQWFDGKRYRTAWLSETEVMELVPSPSESTSGEVATGVNLRRVSTGARLVKDAGRVRIWRLDAAVEGRAAARKTVARTAGLTPVFYSSSTGGVRMALPGDLLVNFQDDMSDEQVRVWAAAKSLTIVRAQLPEARVYLLAVEPGLAGLALAKQLNLEPEIEWAIPNWWREIGRR